ncbi:PREDICTED: zinc finger BED domain-containing protein RICESLEEPER 2-like isoform X2 [Populus euphratica]|uniref:Zinc finger BED domain-containing protein RICESLEEPER 2-like isoform X2 n=1 Tax=Populus euphratica TaxID=75702 RepID=A0AAJ6TN40_POPEU|nr:PREDICTED: zinc finger BED domain-containing protein RICESLEEPER 2-like isoform X2 [Populus euphratica]
MASPLSCILMVCARAIEGGRLDFADSLLAEIQSLPSKEESIWTRNVVKYCAEALVRRAYRIRPPCTLPSLPLLCEPFEYMYEPFYEFATITSKHAIADALNSGYKRLHIIDFSIMFDFWWWNSLIKELKEQCVGLQSVLITTITPKLSKHSDRLRKNQERARQFGGTNLELRQLLCNRPDDIVNCISKLRRKRKDEIVVVNWNFTLHKLLAQDGAMEQVLSKVKDLEVDIMVIVEQDANLNSPDLSERLEQSFQYYSTIFESLEKAAFTKSLWETYFRRQIGNVVACEGVDRVERIESFAQWKNRRIQYAAFAIRLTSTHPCKDDYVLEFLLPRFMKDTSARELLINKVLRTLQRKCLKLWKVWFRELNEGSGSEVRLDDERMANIPQETREPLEQDVQEQSAIPAPALNGENASLSGLQSTNKRRKISAVWDGFVKHRKENGEVWATCKYCKKMYRAEATRGTSNFRKHLKKCLPTRQDEAEQQILVETGDLSTSVIQRNFVIDQERSRVDIATMMIKHGYPLTMVQHEFFVKNFQQVFKLYSKDVVEADVLAICRQEKEKLINFFDKLSSLLSLTLELWSSTDKMMTYCCFTVHFIDDGWQLKKKILAFRNLRYNYDMGTVHEVFKSVLTEWSINKNIRFIFLDITPPKDHMIGELRSKVSDQAPHIHGHLFCVPSYAQILSLLAQDGFSEIRSVLYKIRECIEYVNGSSLRRQRFQEAINNGSLQDREMPPLDVPARWDTTFLMLESSLEFITAFNHLEQLDDDFKVNPSAGEWNKATAVFECLKELYKSTCNFPTSRDGYFLSVHDVYKNLQGWKQSDYVYVRAMANRMKGKFDEYWGEASLALGISAVLDPSYKLDIIEYGYRQIYGSDADLHLSRFHYDLTCAYHKYAKDISNQGPSSSAMAGVSRCTSSDISFKEWRKGKNERNMVHSQWNELDQYLQLPPENLDKDGNVLAWWQDNARNFPILGKMARDFLAIPVSTVISKSSEVMKMASVHDGVRPEIAEALICGKDWLDSPNWKVNQAEHI